MRNVILYLLGRPEHARAVSEDIFRKNAEAHITVVGPETGLNQSADNKAFSRPDLFILLVSNEAGHLKLIDIVKALIWGLRLRPRKKQIILCSWSGRYTLGEKAGEVAARTVRMSARPLYLMCLKAAYYAGEALFPLINGKKRKEPFGIGSIHKALLLCLDLTGDLVWAAPAVSSLKKALPNAQVHLLVHPRNRSLARLVSGVDLIIEYEAPWLSRIHYPSGSIRRKVSRFGNLATRLKLLASGYDLVVDFRGEARHAVLAYFTGAPYRTGLSESQAGVIRPRDTAYLLTHKADTGLKGSGGAHVLERNLGVVGSMGFDTARPNTWLAASEGAKERIRDMLALASPASDVPVIGIQPGASRPEKRWDRDGFAEVASRLVAATGARVAITGSIDEAELARYISGKVPGAVNLAGKTTLEEFIALVERCSLFITNDSSSISISSAVKTPVVALMLTPPEFLGPYGTRSVVLQRKPECWLPSEDMCFCPHNYKCLQEITPDEVYEAAIGLYGESGSKANAIRYPRP